MISAVRAAARRTANTPAAIQARSRRRGGVDVGVGPGVGASLIR
jgi:hypothetical protein